MVNMDNFRDINGRIDWSAYNKAEIDAGERCYKCEGFIGSFGNGIPRLCLDCQGIDKKEEFDHDSFLRCPKCNEVFETADEMYDIFEAGEHNITCPKCNFDFEITTHLTYSFTSPELIEGKQL